MTLEEACDAYLSDVRARNLSGSSIRGYGVLFRKLGRFAAEQGLVNIDEIDAASLRQWRESWSWASSTHQTNLNRLKTFFSFALRAGWISESPAAELRPPKVDRPPTMPLGRAEVAKLVAAAEGMPRERALLLLLRYSGISIRDAATLRRDSVDGRELTLRRTKTGELVICDLPIVVVEALAKRRQGGLGALLLDRRVQAPHSGELLARAPASGRRTRRGSGLPAPQAARHVCRRTTAGRRGDAGREHSAGSFQHSDHGAVLRAVEPVSTRSPGGDCAGRPPEGRAAQRADQHTFRYDKRGSCLNPAPANGPAKGHHDEEH